VATRQTNESKSVRSKRPPGTTPTARENQLVALAVDVAEQQLRNGTASAQVITHFLKLGSSREQLEKERLAHENQLLQAKREQIESAARVEELYTRALGAMRSYQGQEDPDVYED
jgi:hypothetical protein